MAITTYAELQTAIDNWTHRADLTSRDPEFIALCEAKLQRELRAQDMETKSASFSLTGEYVSVPTDFLEVREFYLNSSPRQQLELASGDFQTVRDRGESDTPTSYEIVGSTFKFSPIPGTTTSATLIYYAKIPALSGSNTTNWLLTAHPDVYLYGSLLEASAYMGDDPRIPLWKQGYDYAIAAIKSQGNKRRWGGNSLVARPG